mgnify:CR=1 FL=1
MEKILNLKLHNNGAWTALDENGGDELGFQLEDKATLIKILIPFAVFGFTHCFQIEKPDGTVLETSPFSEITEGENKFIEIPVGLPLTSTAGVVKFQYVGRSNNGKIVKSKILELYVDNTIVGGSTASLADPDTMRWLTTKLGEFEAALSQSLESAKAYIREQLGLITDEDGGAIDKLNEIASWINDNGGALDQLSTLSTDLSAEIEARIAAITSANQYADNKVDIEKERAESAEENLEEKIEEVKTSIAKRCFKSLKRIANYLFEITFDSLPTYKDIATDTPIGGCTSFVRDGKLYRNFDFNFDNTAEFIVNTKNFKGMASIIGLNDSELNNDELLSQLPYHVVDGNNKYGIKVSTHVLYNDFDYEGSGEKTFSLTRIPFEILSRVKSISTIENDLLNVFNNIKIPTKLQEMGYLLQFLVTDGTNTVIIAPPTSASGNWTFINANSNPKLTNFRYLNKTTVTRDDNDLQLRPTGIERWNLISNNTKLSDLRFTLAYESNTRLSEFIGLRDTTKESSNETLESVYNTAHSMYTSRTRNGDTWHTVYSIVYSKFGIEHLWIQEDYCIDYANNVNVEKERAEKVEEEHTQKLAELESALQQANETLEEKVDKSSIADDKDDDSKLPTIAIVKSLISALVDSAPSTLDTLNELAEALDNDPNFAATVAAQIGEKLGSTEAAQIYATIQSVSQLMSAEIEARQTADSMKQDTLTFATISKVQSILVSLQDADKSNTLTLECLKEFFDICESRYAKISDKTITVNVVGPEGDTHVLSPFTFKVLDEDGNLLAEKTYTGTPVVITLPYLHKFKIENVTTTLLVDGIVYFNPTPNITQGVMKQNYEITYVCASTSKMSTLSDVKTFLALDSIDEETKRNALVNNETNDFTVDVELTNPETNVKYTMPVRFVEVCQMKKLVDGQEVTFLGARCQFAYTLPDNIPFDEREQVLATGETFQSGVFYYQGTLAALGDQSFTPLVEGTDYQVGDTVGANIYKHAWSNTQYGTGNSSTAMLMRYGSNIYHESNIHKWLNGSGLNWWSASHLGDVLATWYQNKHGFKDWFKAEELAVIEKDVAFGVYERTNFTLPNNTLYAQFVLLSGTEVAGSVNANEGNCMDYWKYLNGGVVKNDANANRTITKITAKTSKQTIWLRSPYRSYSYYAWSLYASGSVGNYSACNSIAVVPTFVI